MSPSSPEFEALGALLDTRLEQDPRVLERLHQKITGYLRGLDPSPPWVPEFLGLFDLPDLQGSLPAAWHSLSVRTYQALERIDPFPLDEMARPDAAGRLDPAHRAVLFARLCGPNPDWEAALTVHPPVCCPISAALDRLRRRGEGAERARHVWTASRAWLEPLGFGELALEEARELSADPQAVRSALESMSLLVHDPILAFEHPPARLAALRSRWQLYLAEACWKLGDRQWHGIHMQYFAREAQASGPDPELLASGHEHRAEVALSRGQRFEARHRLSMALAALPGDREELDRRRQELLARLDALSDVPAVVTPGRGPRPMLEVP